MAIDTTSEHGVRMIVGARRKDGRHPVTFRFLSTGAKIVRLMTAEQIAEARAKYE